MFLGRITQNVVFLIFSYPIFNEISVKFFNSGLFYAGLYCISFLTARASATSGLLLGGFLNRKLILKVAQKSGDSLRVCRHYAGLHLQGYNVMLSATYVQFTAVRASSFLFNTYYFLFLNKCHPHESTDLFPEPLRQSTLIAHKVE